MLGPCLNKQIIYVASDTLPLSPQMHPSGTYNNQYMVSSILPHFRPIHPAPSIGLQYSSDGGRHLIS